MRRLAIGVLLLLSGTALALPPPMALPEQGGVLDHVNLLVPGQPLRQDMSLTIEGGVIAGVEAAGANDNSPYAGMYVVPSLVDMHVHWPALMPGDEEELFAFLYLYHGVTTVRSMGDLKAGTTEGVRKAIAGGKYPGPSIFNCAYLLDGPDPQWRSARVLVDAAQAHAVAAELKAEGADCLKVYDGIQAPVLAALHEAGDSLGLPVVGHVPHDVPFDEALLDDMQHMRGLYPPADGPLPPYPFFLARWQGSDAQHLEYVVGVTVDNGLAVTPTLITLDRLLASEHYASLVKQPEYDYLPDYYTAALWSIDKGMNAARFMGPDDFTMVRTAVEREKAMVAAMYQAGVPIYVGTDAGGGPAVVPGISVHQEMALLQDAGMPPAAVLETATLGARRALGADVDVLSPGAPADFVVLEEDPRENLSALLDIVAVVVDGRIYRRAALDAQLQQYIEANENFTQRKLVTPIARLVVNMMIERELKKRQSAQQKAE